MWLVGVAVLGFVVSSYLALYQYGLLEDVWEPFFGRDSEKVLHSFLSTLLPVPDAAFGAAAYALDAVTGVIGRQDRWRSMPWHGW